MEHTLPTALPDPGVIQSDPAVLGGTPVFAGTRVPVQAFLESLDGGWSIEEFLERHPDVQREQVIALLWEGTRALLARDGRRLDADQSPAVRDKADVLRRLATASVRIRMLGVRRLSLFGSFARGEQRSGSDVDILVEFERGGKSFENFMGLVFLLEEVLGRKVQLVSRDALSPHVGPHILNEAEHVPLAR